MTIAGQSAVTDANGVAHFTGLPPGTHDIIINKPGYMYNAAPEFNPQAEWDTDGDNDTVTVPVYPRTGFVCKPTFVQIVVQCTITTSEVFSQAPGYAGPTLLNEGMTV